MTAWSTVPLAVAALRGGAAEFAGGALRDDATALVVTVE
jgi:hypothetical protein